MQLLCSLILETCTFIHLTPYCWLLWPDELMDHFLKTGNNSVDSLDVIDIQVIRIFCIWSIIMH